MSSKFRKLIAIYLWQKKVPNLFHLTLTFVKLKSNYLVHMKTLLRFEM